MVIYIKVLFFSFTVPSFLVPLVCSIIGLVGLLAIIVMIVLWHNRWHHRRVPVDEPLTAEHKTNNETDTTSLRRYRNPLFETDKGGGTPKSPSTELIEIEIDIEKYEKSPRKVIGRKDSTNENKPQNTPMLKNTRKPKDINIQLSRTRSADREMML